MRQRLPKIDTAQAVVLVALIAGVVAVALFAPSEYHAPIAAALTALAGVLRSPVSE